MTSSSEGTTFVMAPAVNPLSISLEGRTLYVAGSDRAVVEVFDMQGRPIVNFTQVSGPVNLDMLRQGSFVVRVRAGSMNLVRRIAIR